jgi:hypothetical protein
MPKAIMTVAAQWASLETMQMGHLPPIMRASLRKAFYCGAKAMFDMLHDTAEPQLREALNAELEAYRESVEPD